MSQSYDNKFIEYFGNARREIEPLLPAAPVARALEIGCGSGATMAWLKQTGRVRHAVGVELFETVAVKAREHFDEVLVGDAETLVANALGAATFDLVLCLDVLEHMVDPWRFVEQVQRRLAPGGALVISVPNIRCLRVLLPLAFRGQFRYADFGILDRTHLRFFTRESALELAGSSGLRVERCIGYVQPDTRLAQLERWTFGRWLDLTAQQFLIKSLRAT